MILVFVCKFAGYKSKLFGKLKGKAERVLEIGIGTGPNLSYYANDSDVEVFAMDPNKKMEKYARAAAVAAGLPLPNFKFVQAVCNVPFLLANDLYEHTYVDCIHPGWGGDSFR